jgi:hypothetical protein
MTGSEAADSSSIADSEGGDIAPEGKRSSSERYELADDSESEVKSDGRLGQDGKAQAALMPMADENDDLRGLISNKPSLGEGGGGGGGGNDEGEGEEAVLVL